MWSNSKRLIGGSISLIITVSCCGFLYFSFISYPSTKTIANRYLQAVTRKDLEAALELGRSREHCQDNLRESILMDIEKFGGSKVRDVEIDVHGNTGSDDEMQFADIRFAYSYLDQDEWQEAEMKLATDHEVPGLRYLVCGNMLSGQ